MKPAKKTNTKDEPNRESKKLFNVIAILIPIVFFVLLETGLRIFNYGNDYPVFIRESELFPDKLILNPDLPSKYFTNLKGGPGVAPDAFDKVKRENAFRVFVLGESSTAGWPFVFTASFPSNLKRKLELLYPENTIEVINCGISAINTYTIRDIIPAIIEQKPDLILIYSGHNEYYGALGVGSTISAGRSRTLINIYLWALKFNTTQLVSDIVYGITSIFSAENEELKNAPGETLMSRMIGESTIPLNSDLYKAGIEQFEDNMKNILEMFKEESIPVIIGTQTCNTKDLKPFVSMKYDNLPPAAEIFNNAVNEYERGNLNKAEELFLYAKELDALRFRAPAKINKTIKSLSKEFNYNLVDVDSIFKALSPNGIVGYNLTVDHLHPTIEGYRIIAESFLQKMDEIKIVPDGRINEMRLNVQDSILTANFPYTPLDSVISYLKLIQLVGSYPFVPKEEPNKLIKNFKIKNFIDSAALKVISRQLSWGDAHGEAASWYYNNAMYNMFIKEINTLISQRPYVDNLYEQTVNLLIKVKLFNEAYLYLIKLNSFNPSFFTTKWLGQIEVQNKNYKEAQGYLEKAIQFSR